MLNLSLRELKLIPENGDIKGYQSISDDELLSALIENERNFDQRIVEIRKKFNDSRHKFSKSKINKIRKNLYEIENRKIFLHQEKKRLKKIFSN